MAISVICRLRFFWLSQLRCGKRTILGSLVDVLERSCEVRILPGEDRVVSSSLGGMAGMSGKPARGGGRWGCGMGGDQGWGLEAGQGGRVRLEGG